jgi:ankyrin repeat protein
VAVRGDHPIIEAAEVGDLDRIREILSAEPELVNVRGRMGITPLIAATWRADSAEVVGFLLAQGADPLAVRSRGDGALHWAASGAVARLLGEAAGTAGFDARSRHDRKTPLHVAADEGRADVVAAFLAAGADPDAVDRDGNTPLDLADNPPVALLLAAVATPQWTDRPSTPLHDACRRARNDPEWLRVAEVLLERGADPGQRDGFGALPSDLLDSQSLRDRMVEMVLASGRAVDLLPSEVAAHRQLEIAIHPDGTQAVTNLFSGAVLARWQLSPEITPVEVVRLGRRTRATGPNGSLAFADHHSVWLRDWADLRRVREIPEELLPDDHYPYAVLSPDGRYLLLPSCEILRMIDLERGVVAAEDIGCGDWSIRPRFSPDGRTVAVGNSMQGVWWLTVHDVADGTLRERWELDWNSPELPTCGGPEIVSDVAFSPDGGTVATWVRPDQGHTRENGYRGLVATTRAESGEFAWHRKVDNDVAATEGTTTSAALCYTPDGSRLAVGLDTGILWLDAETGAVTGHDHAIGRVHALAAHPAVGVLAATDHGLRRVAPGQG